MDKDTTATAEKSGAKRRQGGKGTPWVKGQSGNPAGKPLGARHAIGQAFLRDFHAVWEKRGRIAIEEMDATELVRVAAKLLPAEVNVGGPEGGPVELVIRWGGAADGDGGSGAG
jgi:hypothetical protein